MKLIESNRMVHQQFEMLIKPLREELWRFCTYITGSVWDGEDLFQETLIKAYGMLHQRYHPTNPKSYLYRVATNTWIDQCRKMKLKLGELTEEIIMAEDETDSLEVEDALYSIASILPPRQAIAILLIDVFQFKADEIAGMLNTTRGGVYASVQRARATLANNAAQHSTVASHFTHSQDRKIIKSYIEAFNRGDIETLISLFSDQALNETTPGFQEYSKDEMKSGSLQSGSLGAIYAEERTLWGREVIITLARTDNGIALHDVQFQETENGKIVCHKSYFFCKEFLFAAAKELDIPIQLKKPPVNWIN